MRRRTLLHLPLARGIAVLVLLAAPGLLSPEASHAQDPEPDWATQLVALYQRGEDPASIWGYVETIDAMTPEMIRDAAARHFDLQNYVRVTLFPESMRQGMPPATRPSNPDP